MKLKSDVLVIYKRYRNLAKHVYKDRIKRAIDVFLCICGLILCSIPMLCIAAAIKLDSKGPVIFRQKRLGKNQKIFTILKFRTMCVHAYEAGGIVTSPDDARITRVGAFLRRTSLDELPQMINIIQGDMAIIGPRPILPAEFEEYKNNENYRRRYDVLPGLFCTVDVVNRAAERKRQFEMDAEYAGNITFREDLRIFLKIIVPVLKGSNVYKEE